MNPKDYVKNVLVTENRDFTPLKERFSQSRTIRLLHGAVGLASELAEIRQMGQHEAIDEVNLKEEMGDLCWYMGIMVDELGIDPDAVFKSIPINQSTRNSNELHEHIDNMTIDIGEMIDLLKKNLIYGKPLNVEAVQEKLHSLSCEIEAALNVYDLTSSQSRERNIEKLKARYGEKFSEAAALERNLAVEREILEKK